MNTSAGFGGECHLDAVMVRSGMSRLPLDDLDLLVIENVGNLVCPAEFRVGEGVEEWCAWLSGSGQTRLGGVSPASTSHTP